MYALRVARPFSRAVCRTAPAFTRTIMTPESIKYTAVATASGGGRNGKSQLADGSLDIKMAVPKEMGGAGDGHNPEQLFALGYAACFLGAFRAAAGKAKVHLPQSTSVTSHVHIGPYGNGFALGVDLEVRVPESELKSSKEDVEAAVNTAHAEICPYSNATRGNVDVKVSVKYD